MERIRLMVTRVAIPSPFNSHVHWRFLDEIIEMVARHTYKFFCGAVVITNFDPPADYVPSVLGYKDRLETLLVSKGVSDFVLVPTLMLTDRTTTRIIEEAVKAGVSVLKWIPIGASTNSSRGVPLYQAPRMGDIWKAVKDNQMVVQPHTELIMNPATGEEIDPVRREQCGIEYLLRILKLEPDLLLDIPHVSTWEMVNFIRDYPGNVTGQIAPQHLIVTTDMVRNKKGMIVAPHLLCNPMPKSFRHVEAVREAIANPGDKFHAGDDSAPHLTGKDQPPYSTGCYTAPVTPRIYVQVMEEEGVLDRSDAQDTINCFFSTNAQRIYRLNLPVVERVMVREVETVPQVIDGIVPLMAGRTLHWKIAA